MTARLGLRVHRGKTAADATLAAVLATASDHGDSAVIKRAYAVADHWHCGQRRYSGHPYITHPVAVALILAELGMSTPVLCAGLLHDVIDDTPCTLTMLRREFGDEIANLVHEVSRLHATRGRLAAAAPPASAHANVALIIKLADRLHNMRTLRYVSPAKQQQRSREALERFAPLARALGLDALGGELAGLATAVLANPSPASALTMPRQRRCGPGTSRRLLAATVVLLPVGTRERWLEEWTGELSVLRTRRACARFTVQMLTGMPRLAATLRWPIQAT